MSITEVSKVAGVSIATVSRVINGYPYVSKSARDAVQTAIEKVGYHPSPDRSVGRPRSMPQGMRTGNVAVFFPDQKLEALRTPLTGRLLHGIDQALRQQSLTMLIAGLDEHGGMPSCITRKQVDGVIVRGVATRHELSNSFNGTPLVWVFEDAHVTSWQRDMVREDNLSIGVIAADWLIDRGHSRLAFLNLMPGHASFRVRKMVFCDQAEHRGATVRCLARDRDQVDALLDEFVASANRATGVFVPGGDREVIEVYRGLRDRGLRVGSDFDFISCNNDPTLLSALDPSLPNIDIQPEMLGRAAVDTLLWRMSHAKEHHRSMVVPPLLVQPTVPAAAV